MQVIVPAYSVAESPEHQCIVKLVRSSYGLEGGQ